MSYWEQGGVEGLGFPNKEECTPLTQGIVPPSTGGRLCVCVVRVVWCREGGTGLGMARSTT